MRELLRKMFYWNAPAEGAAFASLLFWLGGWCLATVFVLFDGIAASFCIAITELLTAADFLEWLFDWPQILLLAGFSVFVYHLIVTGHFYHTLIREKWRYGIWFLTALLLGGSVAAAWFYGETGLLIFLYVMLYWVFPLVCMPKQWKWLIPAAFGPILLLFPFAAAAETLDYLLDSTVKSEYPVPFAMHLMAAAPWLLWPLVLLAVLCGLCCFKAYAGAAGKPFRTLFGKGAAAMTILFLLTYGVSLGTAYAARCRTDRSLAELEKHFGRSVSAAGLKELYYLNRKPDGAFWRKALALKPGSQPQKNYDLMRHPAFRLPPEELAGWRKRLESSRKLHELEMLFETELPAFECDFRQGMIAAILFPELNILREFAFGEAWRVRFAVADRDPAAASAALARFSHVRDYLARQIFLIPALVMCAVENIRLDALERFLSSGLPSDAWLAGEQKRLAEFRKRMETVNYHALYGEAVMIMDACWLVASGSIGSTSPADPDLEMAPTPGLYEYRWLFPAGWYQLTRTRRILAESYRTTDLSLVVYKRDLSDTAKQLAGLFLPTLNSAGKKLHALSARCLAMETLIGIELEKRSTGKYPDTLENPPLDPFGEPLIYRKGKLPYIQYQRTAGSDHPYGKEKRITVDAVAVWSKGADRKDDQGLSNWKENGERTDDARAMLITEPKGILP